MSLLAALQGGRPFGGPIFRCTTKDRGERRASSSQAPHPSFCLSGQKLSRSAAPPLPTKPTSLGFGGAPVGGPLNPRSNVLGHSDVLCAYLFPQGDFLRARNGAFDAIKSRMACSALLPCALRAAPRRRGFSIAVGSALGVRCSEKQQDLCNHPTSDYKLSWLFFQCQRIRRSACGTIESVEAVRSTPRTGLNRVNCTRAHT